MNKHLQKLVLAALLVPVSVGATEMRTPWVLGDGPIHGPLRYTFEKLHKDKGNLNVWSAMHLKEANRAFLKESTKTQDISALIFGQQDFTLNQIFPNSVVPLNSQFFNPFMAIKALHPRVEYTEYGATVGMRWDHPLCEKGRIGLRVVVPFRHIEMERQDSGLDENEVPTDDFVDRKVIRVNVSAVGRSDGDERADILVSAYRMDLLASLPNAVNQPLMVGAANSLIIANQQLASDGAINTNPAALTTSGVSGRPVVDAYMYSNGAALPAGGYDSGDGAAPVNGGGPTNPAINRFIAGDIHSLGADYVTNLPTATSLAFFDSTAGNNYGAALTSAGFATNSDSTWLVFRRQTDAGADLAKFGSGTSATSSSAGSTAAAGIENILAQYTQNAYDFFQENNFDFDSRTREGMGDIDLDLFYEYTFNTEWMGELNLGVRLPTGGSKNQYGNPYIPQLGNGEHWEIKIGAMGCYQPLSWMNMALDARYAFVLEGTEHRIAAFQGATIKNIGPRADADVDWGYFVGHFDFNFFHPKNSGIRSLVGYEFYYKTEDHLKFKQAAMQSWLGGEYVGGALVANPEPLSNDLAKKDTESIAHKVRFETSVQLLTHFEVFAGGSLTFAGQNVMRDRDAFGGFNVRF